MDTFSKSARSRIMSAVRSKNARSTERKLRATLVAFGVRGWRYQAEDLVGKPDFIFPHKKVAIFLDGCFWHGCPKCYRRPQSSRRYWDGKVAGNMARDRSSRSHLRRQGWRVIRIWEHELAKNPKRCIERIKKSLQSAKSV